MQRDLHGVITNLAILARKVFQLEKDVAEIREQLKMEPKNEARSQKESS